jgi:hypothetical protein
MIKQQEKKKVVPVEPANGKGKLVAPEFANITYNPELDKFSGDEFVPEKQKRDEIRLAKSILPPFK